MRIRAQLIVFLEATPIFTLQIGELKSSCHTLFFFFCVCVRFLIFLFYQVQFNVAEAGTEGREKKNANAHRGV